MVEPFTVIALALDNLKITEMKKNLQLGLLFSQLFGLFIGYAITLFMETGFFRLFVIYALIAVVFWQHIFILIKLDDK